MKEKAQITVLAAVAFLVATGATGSGFSVYEQGAKASGLAGAWVAQSDDAAANWYNPAALAWLEQSQLQFGANLITAGADTQITANDPAFGVFTPTTYETVSTPVTPVHLYYAGRFTERVRWGIGINNPYGLISEWDERPVTFAAARSELVTFVVNPNVAFRLNDQWALAVGVDYIFADIKEFAREVPIDLDNNPLNGFEVIGRTNLSGDGDDVGFNLALHYRGEAVAFGLTYRSALSPEIDGDAEFRGFGPLSPFFRDQGGTAVIDLPVQAVAGIAWDRGERWSFEVDLAWAGWSSFESLDIDFADETPPFVQDISLAEDWDDTFSYRFGAAYRSSPRHEWRFGALYDESPVPPETLRPTIPDADRWAVSFGYGYTGGKWSVDTYYMPLFFKDATAVSGEAGVIAGKYESFGHLAGLSLTRRFR